MKCIHCGSSAGCERKNELTTKESIEAGIDIVYGEATEIKRASMGYYKDIRELARVLEDNDKLVRVQRVINKDTELMPLV